MRDREKRGKILRNGNKTKKKEEKGGKSRMEREERERQIE